ncbi:putative protein OS=Streptomyces albaduncus OX=68172 GN=FHS32_000719 PE=4 SV=1 [Streptomyces griseoloalbus]|uniref:Bacteriocin n=1 Tax=Streptomyces pseudogriseolus TaxID=36817 RepID=A0ABQ2T499_STREZ|nr:hypothetical protein [Streptomyces rubiginosus]GGS52349.1 hypothetical protein GCM10010285_34790 [Streptomyces rubiginosus]
MNLVPRVETAELSDADLDHVSGGQSVSAGLDAGVAVVLGYGSVGVGVYAEAGPLSVSAGLGGSVSHAGAVHTTMV